MTWRAFPKTSQGLESWLHRIGINLNGGRLGSLMALPALDKRRAPDRGIDGYLKFPGEKRGSFETIVCQVKSGAVSVATVRELKGVMERERAAMGVLVTLQNPTHAMRKEAISAGFYQREILGTS